MANWFQNLITKHKDYLGISEVIPTEQTTAESLGTIFGKVSGFLRAFTSKAGDIPARSQPPAGTSGALAGFTTTLKGFAPILLLGGALLLVIVLRKR